MEQKGSARLLNIIIINTLLELTEFFMYVICIKGSFLFVFIVKKINVYT